MTPEEADKLIREAEAAHDKRPASEKSRPTATKIAAERAAVAKAEAAARAAAQAAAMPPFRPALRPMAPPPPPPLQPSPQPSLRALSQQPQLRRSRPPKQHRQRRQG